ncbi:MAG: membrane dipeptidase [Candidatus Bathyarchaeia archaeon]
MNILLKSGRIVDPSTKTDKVLDILISEGKIALIGKNLKYKKSEIKLIDVSGKVVIPGVIDIHTHLREPGHEEEETIATGTLSAAKGGITSVFCMANTHPVIDNQTAVEFILLKAKNEGKVAIFLGFQSIDPLEGNLAFLRVYHKLGVRIIQPTYHFKTIVGDGCAERTDCGLSLFGIDLIEKMNKLGMLIDLAHVGKKTGLEIIEVSKDPVIFSHSNARTLVDTYQNKTDEEIKAAAEKGGVIGISLLPRLLGNKPNLSINDLMNHIDYAVNLVGAKHVGIGTDFIEGQAENPEMKRLLLQIDGEIYRYPKDMDTITKFSSITKALVARGYSDDEIKKILGENFMRVFKRVFKE